MKKTMVILGAGRGTRLGDAARDRPKCMVEICGSPIAKWQFQAARQAGINRVVIVRGHAAESVQVPGAELVDNPDYATTNMVASLWCARRFFSAPPEDTLIISYGDILYNPEILAEVAGSRDEISVAVDHQWLPYWQERVENVLDDAETMRLDATGRILDLGQKAMTLDEIQGQYIGLLAFRGAGLKALNAYIEARLAREAKGLPAGVKPFAKLFMTDLLRELIHEGHSLREVPIQGGWVEIDSASDLELAKRFAAIQDGQLRIERSRPTSGSGRVIWLTGLSGAGKSTIAQQLKRKMESSGLRTSVWVDGDHFREILGNDLGHDQDDRLKNALRLSRFCRFLSSQGLDVICSTMSLFHECQEWNRKNIPGYIEVYLDVPMQVLEQRDAKGLYGRAREGKVGNVVGVHLPFEAPRNPDLVISHPEMKLGPGAVATELLRKIEPYRRKIVNQINLNSKEWDYTHHAHSYSSRPNYADSAIDELVRSVGARPNDPGYVVADIGAGTANLTLMLLARNLRCIAVEPNQAMRDIGMERTRGKKVEWKIGTGEATTLADHSVDWITFGSSFNTTDRQKTLKEVARALKPRGYFTCMWNHRNLDDPLQSKIEAMIRKMVPSYTGGTRREDQTGVIDESGLFEAVQYIERDQPVIRTPEQYVDAWRSTRNLSKHSGDADFDDVLAAIQDAIQGLPEIRMTYTTRVWTARLRK